MSWFGKLIETYDRVSDISGISDREGKDSNVLLPQNHMTAKTDICITLDGDGNFRRAEETPQKIIIPCTEDSSSRTSGIQAHPLHDQLGYLLFSKKKHDAFIAQLALWKDCHPKVTAVYKYIMGNTIADDLRKEAIVIDVNENDENGQRKPEKKIIEEQKKVDRLFVRFRVEVNGDLVPNLWEDKDVIEAWQNHCAASQSKEKMLCYATGIMGPSADKHPKGINPSANGAKLISCNDNTNYTYRGRFSKPDQANTIGENASYKAHAMLKYLIATQGYKCDSQAVVAWTIDDGSALLDPFEDSLGIYADCIKTEKDKLLEAQNELGVDYAKKFRNALGSRGNAKFLTNQVRRVAVIATDAATTGRMGITFYQDLSENEYNERIVAWHESCNWFSYNRKSKREYISAPSADSIIAVVYGEPKGENYVKIKKQARERLLSNIVCGESLDRSWITAAVARVSSPFSYSKKEGGWDKNNWEKAKDVTCAIVKKYFNDKGGSFFMELDTTCNDRDYLFGRLLAIADRLESHARYLQVGISDTDKRPTNAVRYITAFASKPMRTWNLIYKQLNPYMQRLDGAEGYQKIIDEVMSLFNPDEYSDGALDGKYLLGYSLQRRALFNKKEEVTNEFNEEN